MAYPKPITQKEMYLAKAIGEYDHVTPRPITRIDTYLGKNCGDWDFPLPKPITREEMYLAKIAGSYDYPTPSPITRVDLFLAAIAGDYDGELPTSITREEIYMARLAELTGYVVRYAEGNPLLLSDTLAAPLESLHIYGKTTQQTTTGVQLYDGGEITLSFNESDHNVNVGEVKIPLRAGDVFQNGAFLSFYCDIDMPDMMYFGFQSLSGQVANWGVGTSSNVKKGYNEVKLNEYAFIEGQDNVGIQIRRTTTPFTFTGTLTLSNIFLKAGQEPAPYEPYTGGKPSPSPDYPQPLVSLAESGEIGVDVMGGNLFDIKKASAYIDAYGLHITIEGEYVTIEGEYDVQLGSPTFRILTYPENLYGNKISIDVVEQIGTNYVSVK